MDSALALGMIRYILDNNRHDAAFLCHPTLAAARNAGEAGFSNATHLVRLSGKQAGALLRWPIWARRESLPVPTRTTPWS